MEFYDVLRIDHFNGVAEYYSVPYGDETAENGKICKGPGMDFFKKLKEKLGKSGVSHRLDKLSAEAEKIRKSEQKK
jgi:4-alpha-glucanotransferase